MLLKKNESNLSSASLTSTNFKSLRTNKLNRNKSANDITLQRLQNKNYSNIPINTVQSPKISTNQQRSISQPKQFSLIDINDKITNKRGTDLPEQFKRRTPEEVKDLLNQTSQQLLFKNKPHQPIRNIIHPKFERSQKQFEPQNLNRTKVDECTFTIEENLSMNKPSHNKSINRSIQTALPSTRNTRLYKPYIMENSQYINYKDKVPKDSFKPKDYDFFDSLIKNAVIDNHRSKSSNIRTKENSLNHKQSSLPCLSKEQIKRKCYDSDIFFQRKETNNNYKEKVSKIPNYQNSDIFHLKNDPLSISKSGEKSYFKPRPDYKYTVSRESNSQWHPKNLMPTLLNYSSTEHHILNPGIKNISNTKKELEEQCEKVSTNYHLGNRQKSLCEFIDLSRVGAPHQNKDYLEMYSKDKRVFGKRNDICSDYYDIFGCYKNLCDKPFAKFKVIQGEL